jgi:hypothetical protein
MDRARVDAQSALSLPLQLPCAPRALDYAPFCAGPNAPAGLPTPAVPAPQFSEHALVGGPGGVNQPPPLPLPSSLVFPYGASLNPHYLMQLGALGAMNPALQPPPAAGPGRPLVCTFTNVHSKAVGVKGKVKVQEKPFSRVAWVEMKNPSPPICERCTSTLQKHFKNSTTSKQLCREFLKYVFKYRCRLCNEWCLTHDGRNADDFLCAIHTAEEVVNQSVAAAAGNTGQVLTSARPGPNASSSANGGRGPLEPDGARRDGASNDRSAAHPAPSGKDTHKRALPYDPKVLHWNSDRTMNAEQKYCYCGQNKQVPLLRCSLCKNWFHHDCTSDVVPAKDSGRFLPFQLNYDFTCALCSSSNCERFELITCSWIDSILGAMGNLMWETQRECFKVVEVADHLEKYWDILCYRRQKNCNWRGPLNSYFTNNKERLRQQKPYWWIADPQQDELGPILQPCRVLRGPARPPLEDIAKLLRGTGRPSLQNKAQVPRGLAHPSPQKAARPSKAAATREDQQQIEQAAATRREQHQIERAAASRIKQQIERAAATREHQIERAAASRIKQQIERAAATREQQQHSERAAEAKPGGLPLFNALNAVAAQLLLEADHLAARRFAAGGDNCLPQNSLQFKQELLPARAVAPTGTLLPVAAGQQLARAPAGAFLPAAAESQLPTLLDVPAVKQQLPTAPAMTMLDPADKRSLPANAQGVQVGSVGPPTKRSRQEAKASQNATLEAAAAASMAYDQLAFL